VKFPVSQPSLSANARKYVLDCLDENWISSNGKYLDLFEKSLGRFLGNSNTLVAANGTVALHLALLALNLKPGDEVLVPSLTYVATANAITYCGATPIFIDTDSETWNSPASDFEEKITSRTVGILAVHLYGSPCDVIELRKICDRKNLWLVEDCAEALGASMDGKMVGNFGDVGTYSFYGNKIITTGEGGALTFQNPQLEAQARLFRGQGMDLSRRYWHTVVGYNYRMTNIEAAIGYSQMEDIDTHISKRSKILQVYKHSLQPLEDRGIISFQKHLSGSSPVNWLTSFVINDKHYDRDRLILDLGQLGIETRPFFHPVNSLPMYLSNESERANDLSKRGINLPTYGTLSEKDIEYICSKVLSIILGSQTYE